MRQIDHLKRESQQMKADPSAHLEGERGPVGLIRKDATGIGDCQVFTQTYLIDCQYAGLNAARYVYWLADGRMHAVCIVTCAGAEWVLDCRERRPVKK